MSGRWWLRASAALLSLVLAACGGGGGDGGSNVRVSADKDKVAVLGLNGHAIANDTIHFTLEGGSGTYYAAALSDSDAVGMQATFPSDKSASVTVDIGTLATGTRTSGQLTFLLCRDAACKDEVWRQQVPYAATMYSIDTQPLTLTGSEGASSAPVTLSVAPADTSGELVFDNSQAGFVTIDHSAADKLVITPSGVGLSAGSYSGTIVIDAVRNGIQTTTGGAIQASFTVGKGIVAPAVAAIDLVATSTATSLRRQATVSFAGGQRPRWTASSDSAWLVLDTASGTGAGTIDLHVDTSKTAAMINWQDQQAQVTISAPGLTSVSFPVTLKKRLPDIAIVTPSGIYSGQATEVRVTGRGLTGLTKTGFSVGGVAPSAVTIESDSAATLSLPAFEAGARRITATSALGDAGATAMLGVRDPGTFIAASVPTSGLKRAAVFDASRNAVFATNYTDNSLVRYRLVGSQWQASAAAVASVGSLALSPDGGTVYVGSGSRLLAIDPDTLQTRRSYAAPFALNGGFNYGSPIAQTHDQRLWFGGDQWDGRVAFNRSTGSFEPVISGVTGNSLIHSPQVYAPADGSALLIQGTGISPEQPMLWYSAATGNLQVLDSGPAGQSDPARFSQDGRLMLLGVRELYRTSDFTLLGNAKVDASLNPWEAFISPDGRRIYVVVSQSGSVVMDHVDVFDTTASTAGSTNFVKLGEIALPDKAVGCDLERTSDCDARGRWLLDPTGTVFFWVADAKMVVIPISSSLSGISATGAAAGASVQLRKSALTGRTH